MPPLSVSSVHFGPSVGIDSVIKLCEFENTSHRIRGCNELSNYWSNRIRTQSENVGKFKCDARHGDMYATSQSSEHLLTTHWMLSVFSCRYWTEPTGICDASICSETKWEKTSLFLSCSAQSNKCVFHQIEKKSQWCGRLTERNTEQNHILSRVEQLQIQNTCWERPEMTINSLFSCWQRAKKKSIQFKFLSFQHTQICPWVTQLFIRFLFYFSQQFTSPLLTIIRLTFRWVQKQLFSEISRPSKRTLAMNTMNEIALID